MTRIEQASAELLTFKLDRAVGGSAVAAVDVIIVKLRDADGADGLGFSYVLGGNGKLALLAAEEQLARFVRDRSVAPPRATWRSIGSSFNRMGHGPNLIGLAAIDVAIWDLHARRNGVPLGVAMGGERRAVPVYGSGDFNTQQTPEQAAEAATAHVARGLRAVKPRVAGATKDAKVIAAVRAAVGDEVALMADANEKCDLVTARRLLQLARGNGLLFVEEPLPWSLAAAYAQLGAAGTMTIAAGEHAQDQRQLLAMMQSGVLGVVQPDLAMIGGLTPALDICVMAEALGAAVSPHFLHGLFAHLAAASPAVTWLEDFPLLEPLFDGWPEISSGCIAITPSTGHGLRLSGLSEHLLKR
ncbi:mandelate racemase/muconate lactonizing enzyme family protein [Bradyrhizobium tropiciagri]|uniref:mandelate racemase/muconate lactonizing enzyme family protein n=1 Tax=Bradyrhizobium tropiciagri TaxID=312253 RepID=UPI001BAB2E13|nr:mandelate racemase/muconate lactonizing enzyme family protein [Bradyrhizobium tropiciagri]MBR0874143.1 mandelate racemase/muconate lactonizing enzyme family protein [Bradyrhizobium tropiciagri]